MTVDQLRKFLRAAPFQPFRIHLADGRALPVEQPEMVAIAADHTIGVADRGDGTIEVVDLLLVTSLEPRSNGRRRKGAPRKKPS